MWSGWGSKKVGVKARENKSESEASEGTRSSICLYSFALSIPIFLHGKVMVTSLKLHVPHFNVFPIVV